jgi:hypothetical protein
MIVGFTTTCVINAYHHLSCEFEPRSWRGALDTTICDTVFQSRATGRWLSPVSSTNKTDWLKKPTKFSFCCRNKCGTFISRKPIYTENGVKHFTPNST